MRHQMILLNEIEYKKIKDECKDECKDKCKKECKGKFKDECKNSNNLKIFISEHIENLIKQEKIESSKLQNLFKEFRLSPQKINIEILNYCNENNIGFITNKTLKINRKNTKCSIFFRKN